jgi:hypothetical protein
MRTGCPLALVDEDAGNGGFKIRDIRDGRSIAWRFCLADATAIAARLNASYPSGSIAPAYDTLVHEAVELRLGGGVV